MKFASALRNMGQLQATTRGLLISNIVLGLGLVYGLVHFNNQRDRIVLVPPSMDTKAVVAWNYANREYLKSFGLYIATLVGNIQPKSSTIVLDSVSAFMDPMIYTDFRRQLLGLIEDPMFKASGSVISFLPGSIQYEPETSRVFVLGTLITSTSGAQKYQKQVVYEIGAEIREGRPWVRHFLSYEGSIPRTVSWHVQQSQKDGKPIPDHAQPIKNRTSNEQATEETTDLSAMREELHPAPAPAPVESPDTGHSREVAATPNEDATEIVESKEPN